MNMKLDYDQCAEVNKLIEQSQDDLESVLFRLVFERDQAREQVKTLLVQRDELAAKLSLVTVALKNLDLAHNHQTLCRAKEEARAAIASAENK